MLIDFTPVAEKQIKLDAFAQQFSVQDMHAASHASIDLLRSLIEKATDAQITFDPVDPHANDPHAKAGEEHIGWNLAHLILHVTASAEENAAVASILARGVEFGKTRLRYEPDWKTVTTKAQVLQRLEESRRIREGYLMAFPDQPFLDNTRELGEWAATLWGTLNARTTFLAGLYHEWQHYDQIREVLRQAQAALPVDPEATVEAPQVRLDAARSS